MLNTENVMDEFFCSKKEQKKSPEPVSIKKHKNYYDFNRTITTALANDPIDFDDTRYNQEQVFVALGRNADVIHISNDEATGSSRTLFVIISHQGGQHFSRERNIEPQEIKEFYNVYEVRLRSATQGAKYRISEYELKPL